MRNNKYFIVFNKGQERFCKLLLYIIILLPPRNGCDIVQAPIVNIDLDEAGFHRDLQYSVQFDYPLAGKDCEYVLEQFLPSAIYISTDQLDDLKRLKRLNAIYPKFVDIEVITEKAEPFSVLIKGTPKIRDSIRLPIHFRYHAPRKDGSSFVTVNITNPDVYMRCPDDNDVLIDNELLVAPSNSYCLNETSCSFAIEFSDSINSVAEEDCDWQRIHSNIRLKAALTAKIPVGNANAYPPILYATIAVSWIVSLYTIFRTRMIPQRINHQLEQQRIQLRKAE